METKVDKADATVAKTEQPQPNVKTESAGAMTKVDTESSSNDSSWKEWLEGANEFFKFPDYMGEFFSDYKPLFIVVGIILSSLIAVKITLAILSSINDIPLLAPIFELVGIGYTGWFIYRYLLQASTRKELVDEFKSLKSQVAGEKSPDK